MYQYITWKLRHYPIIVSKLMEMAILAVVPFSSVLVFNQPSSSLLIQIFCHSPCLAFTVFSVHSSYSCLSSALSFSFNSLLLCFFIFHFSFALLILITLVPVSILHSIIQSSFIMHFFCPCFLPTSFLPFFLFLSGFVPPFLQIFQLSLNTFFLNSNFSFFPSYLACYHSSFSIFPMSFLLFVFPSLCPELFPSVSISYLIYSTLFLYT